jgi:hypothetical protein
MQDAFSVDPKKDMPTSRPLGVDEVDFVVKQRPEDPYGFWWVSREKGQIPDELKGAYTSPARARIAVESYLNRTKKK